MDMNDVDAYVTVIDGSTEVERVLRLSDEGLYVMLGGSRVAVEPVEDRPKTYAVVQVESEMEELGPGPGGEIRKEPEQRSRSVTTRAGDVNTAFSNPLRRGKAKRIR